MKTHMAWETLRAAMEGRLEILLVNGCIIQSGKWLTGIAVVTPSLHRHCDSDRKRKERKKKGSGSLFSFCLCPFIVFWCVYNELNCWWCNGIGLIRWLSIACSWLVGCCNRSTELQYITILIYNIRMYIYNIIIILKDHTCRSQSYICR